MIKLKFKSRHVSFKLPSMAIDGSACFDMTYCGDSPLMLYPHSTFASYARKIFKLPPKPSHLAVPLGCAVDIPRGYEVQIRPRSGLAFNNGITILNSPGTIDYSFTGELKAIVINLGNSPFEIVPGMRICQALLSKLADYELALVDHIPASIRGDAGLGSSGLY